jgi:hypothetical protein
MKNFSAKLDGSLRLSKAIKTQFLMNYKELSKLLQNQTTKKKYLHGLAFEIEFILRYKFEMKV